MAKISVMKACGRQTDRRDEARTVTSLGGTALRAAAVLGVVAVAAGCGSSDASPSSSSDAPPASSSSDAPPASSSSDAPPASSSSDAPPASATGDTTGSVEATPVTVCLDGVSPPQEFYPDSVDTPEGSEIDMLAGIAESANLEITYQKLQFDGLIPALLSNKCDMISAGLFVKPEREEVVDFVLNAINGQSLMVEKGRDEGITGYNETLAGKVIGMPSGYATIPVVQAECEKIAADTGEEPCTIVQFGTVPDTYNSLKTGKVDTVIDATSSIGYFAANNAADFQAVDAEPVIPSDVGFAFRKEDTELSEAVQTAMDDLYSSGEACTILEKWGVLDIALPSGNC